MVAEAEALLDFEVAQLKLLQRTRLLPTEVVPLAQLLGRTLANPVAAVCDLPAFDNSAVDGYALTANDIREGLIGRTFREVGEMRAGASNVVPLKDGETVRIFTGAPVPPGTGGVAMQEIATSDAGQISFSEEIELGDHIRRQGAELRAGDIIASPPSSPLRDVDHKLFPGRLATVPDSGGVDLITPPVLGALAAAGVTHAEVFSFPIIGLLVTGDELISAGAPLQPGQIYESNAVALAAAIQAMGFPAPTVVRCPDDLDAVDAALKELLDISDVVITSGGVSVGDHDVVRPALERLGVRKVFWGVAMKPGKPLYFGQTMRTVVFGLPGNPVSALTTFFLFVRPFLQMISGRTGEARRLPMTLTETLSKKPGRAEFVPCRIDADGAHPFVGRASHKASGLADADGLIYLPKETAETKKGETVEVICLEWGP